MKASTLFLGFTLVVLAAALAGLWQAFGPRPASIRAPSPPAAEIPTLTEPSEPGVRSVYPGGGPTAAPRLAPPVDAGPPATTRSMPMDTAPPSVEPSPERPTAPPQSDLDAVGEGPAETPPTSDAVDLNSASVEALNALGAGMIGKTVVANRPYAAPDDLVTRRILKRQDYETIKRRIFAR